MNKVIYCGIGSRSTPPDILATMLEIGIELAQECILRSGGAPGADQAFELGAARGEGEREIYLPWPSFEANARAEYRDIDHEFPEPRPEAYVIAEEFHPRFRYLSQGAKKLMARNSHQVLGIDLMTPVEFVLCYTPKGSGSGGTGQAIRIAEAYDIPVFDFGAESLEDILDFIDSKLCGG